MKSVMKRVEANDPIALMKTGFIKKGSMSECKREKEE